MTIEVIWPSNHLDTPGMINRGYWDQAFVESLLSGEMYVPGLPEVTHLAAPSPNSPGAIVVLAARWHTDPADIDWLNALIAPLPWVLLILCGDEESIYPWRSITHPNIRFWIQTPHPARHGISQSPDPAHPSRRLGDFARPDTRALLREIGDIPRDRNWFFAGQLNNSSRENCYHALHDRHGRRHDGRLFPTKIFGSGLDYPDYLREMSRSILIPCPSGTFSPDTFRLFEALEAGCIPIAERTASLSPDTDYWSFLFHSPPFPILSDWSDFDTLADDLLTHSPIVLANRISSWWQLKKREIAWWMRDDLESLGADLELNRVDDQVTVLIPTSPIPGHPSTDHIEQTIASVQAHLPLAEIILMIDGVRTEQSHLSSAYTEYTRRLLRLANLHLSRVVPLLFEEHLHQVEMTRRALEYVRTPAVLFVEHDTPLTDPSIGPIPFSEMITVIRSGDADLIRLHHEAAILEPHRHMMLDESPQLIHNIPLLRTVQWSQRPHLANTSFYRRILAEHFTPSSRTMIEDYMHGIVHSAWREYGLAGWDRYRLWMYAPSGDMKRSLHTDTRGDEPKFSMIR